MELAPLLGGGGGGGSSSSSDDEDEQEQQNDLFGQAEQVWNDNTPDVNLDPTGANESNDTGSSPREKQSPTATEEATRLWDDAMEWRDANNGNFEESLEDGTPQEMAAEAGDFLAGDVDEAWGRSFDDEEGGGLYDGAAETLDHFAGSTDEAVARSTDDEEGGGVVDGSKEFAEGLGNAGKNTFGAFKGMGDGIRNVASGRESVPEASAGAGKAIVNAATGGEAEEWREEFWQQERESGSSLAEEKENIQRELARDDTVGNVAAANTAARVGIDALVDNPRGVNVQDGVRDGAKWALRAEDNDELAERLEGAYPALEGAKQWTLDKAGVSDDYEDSKAGWAAGGLFDVFVKDPVKGGTQAATGVNPETGEQETRGEPADIADLALIGGGKAASGAAKGAKAAKGSKLVSRLLGRGDEAAKAGDEAARGAARAGDEGTSAASATDEGATASDDSTEAAAGSDGLLRRTAKGVATAGAVAVAGPKGAKAVSKMGFLDEAAIAGAKWADEGSTGADETAKLADEANIGSLDSFSSFDDLSRSVGTGDEAASGGTVLDESFSLADEGTQAGARASDGTTSIDEMMSGSFDEFASISDEGGSVADDAAARTDGIFDDVFSRGGDEGGSLLSGSDEGGSFIDEFSSATDDLFARGGDEGGSLLSGSDDTASGADDGGSTLDDTASGSDDGASLLDDPLGGFSSGVTRFWDNLGWMGRGTILGIGGLAVTDALGIDFPGMGGTDRRDPGPEGQERYRAEPVKSYQYGALLAIQLGQESAGWNTQGYAIFLGQDKEGNFASSGTYLVLGSDARPTALSPVAGSGDEAVPSARFESEGKADDAYERFEAWLAEQQGGDEEGETPEPDQAPNLDGGLSAPDTIGVGEQFQATWQATLTGSKNALSGRLTLAIAADGGLVPLAESDFTLGGGASTSDSGTFEVPSGWSSVAPGTYDMHAIVMQNGEPAGSLASTGVEVSGDGNDSTEENPWSDPQMVRELPEGWYLYAQARQGTEETRFIISGQREDGTNIYLVSGGNVSTSPDFFPTAEAAAQALRKWMQRPGADGPSEGAGRPDPSDVKKDAADKDENSVAGLVDRLTNAARNRPVVFATGTAVTLGVAYYLYTEGYFETTAISEVTN